MRYFGIFALAAGMAFAAPVTVLAQPMMMHHPYGMRQATGRIVSVQGSSFNLDSGRVVFMKRGTVINPTGKRLRAGQRVTVRGMSAGNHNINAQVVNIMPRY